MTIVQDIIHAKELLKLFILLTHAFILNFGLKIAINQQTEQLKRFKNQYMDSFVLF